MVAAMCGSTEREPITVGKPSTFMMDFLLQKYVHVKAHNPVSVRSVRYKALCDTEVYFLVFADLGQKRQECAWWVIG